MTPCKKEHGRLNPVKVGITQYVLFPRACMDTPEE
jgi:hypothetical protein